MAFNDVGDTEEIVVTCFYCGEERPVPECRKIERGVWVCNCCESYAKEYVRMLKKPLVWTETGSGWYHGYFPEDGRASVTVYFNPDKGYWELSVNLKDVIEGRSISVLSFWNSIDEAKKNAYTLCQLTLVSGSRGKHPDA